MTIRDGGGFPPHKNASGRSDRSVPKVEKVEEDDGIASSSARYSARFFGYSVLAALVGYWLYYMIHSLLVTTRPITAVIIFSAFLAFFVWLWKKISPLFREDVPRK